MHACMVLLAADLTSGGILAKSWSGQSSRKCITPQQYWEVGHDAANCAEVQNYGGTSAEDVSAALATSMQGFAVKVLEKRSDPTTEDARRTTFIMGLGPRGVDPLREVSSR